MKLAVKIILAFITFVCSQKAAYYAVLILGALVLAWFNIDVRVSDRAHDNLEATAQLLSLGLGAFAARFAYMSVFKPAKPPITP